MGLGAAGYATATLNTLGMPVDLPLLLLSFLLVQSLYIRDRLAGSIGDDDATNEPARSAWLMRHGGKLKALAVVSTHVMMRCCSHEHGAHCASQWQQLADLHHSYLMAGRTCMLCRMSTPCPALNLPLLALIASHAF